MRSARNGAARGIRFADFDHTLFACNSTELFIASCKPVLLVAVLDLLIRRCVPWQLVGLQQWFRLRDFACCFCILLLMPWNLLIWRRAAPGLYARLESAAVAERLRRADPRDVVIVSFGMTFVIRHLLRGSPWQDCRLIATPWLPGWRHFRSGKLHLVAPHFSAAEIARAWFITDSRDDGDLLAAVGEGELITPQGEPFRASERLYLPLRYTAAAKYTRSYVLDQILLVDILLLALSLGTSPDALLAALCCVPFLTLSLMCVYEIGYYENDMVAARKEKSPTLRCEAANFRDFPIEPNAWIWAAASGAAGLAMAHGMGLLGPLGLGLGGACWAAMLLAQRAVFYLYNRRTPKSRMLLYPVLNMLKFAPVFVLMPPTKLGVVLALSQVMTMWAVYITYRHGGDHTKIRKESLRLVLFGIGVVLLLSSAPLAGLGGGFQLGMITAWLLLRLGKAPILAARARRRPEGSLLVARQGS
ncbi:hypothetical protein CR162_11905 [Pseudoroseomonas rhizosphaerae]|uniref:Haloacid dehalogenase-like hydrolase n=1 Tax=Teichococcus rhizosphaerae TaxID=1335062 RepID=A0A2C6Y1G6_9PROT|nr:hypothetical protein [Pseudoroseomonas rhizosphaerae]PHK94632.1 hypothetical protein CR162_11905 [Pseudoroseomonas rhizosphaerae]